MPSNLKNCLEKAQSKRFYNLDFLNNAFIYCFLGFGEAAQPPASAASHGPALRSGWPQARPSFLSAAKKRRAEQACEPRSIAAAAPTKKGGRGPQKMDLIALKKAQKCVDFWAKSVIFYTIV